MRNLSVRTKLYALCSSFLLLVICIGVVNYSGSERLGQKIEDLADIQIPFIKNMTMVSVMRDGLRSVAYKALFLSDKDDKDQKKEVQEEFKKYSEAIKLHSEVISKLNIPGETKEAIDKVNTEIETYVKKTEEIVGLSLSGRKGEAEGKLAEFNNAFKALGAKMEALENMIVKNVEESQLGSKKTEELLKKFSAIFILCGLIFGSLISFVLIRGLVRTLAGVIGQLKMSNEKLSSASTESAASATELSEATTEQAASLQETMASIEQISAMVTQNAESAIKVKDAVDINQKVSVEGSQSVAEMLSAIDDIKVTNEEILSQMEASNKEFAEIVKIISDIGTKTNVINEIVFQTKLLSFNASVEAARAGEHGKGFAVVAEEVGNLAQMSGNASKEISNMLSDSIKRVNKIVDSTKLKVDQLVEVGKDKIIMGQSTAQKCKDSLDKISINAKTVAAMIGEVTNASKEQAQGIQEINKAIFQLDKVTQQNSALAQRSSAQADRLNIEANTLSGAVERLVIFASGSAALAKPNKSSPKSERKVIPISEAPKYRSTPIPAKPEHRQLVTKKAVGSQVVPSSEDPNFEEF